ncbi:MAG: mechanosensitive ion channel domain-containing protein, partial [Desulfosarcina sp.]
TRIVRIRLLCCWIAAAMVLAATGSARCEEGNPSNGGGTESTDPPPSLAEVVYRAGTLAQRLATLKNKTDAVDDLQKLAQRLKRAKDRSDIFAARLDAMNVDDLQSYQQLAALKGEVREEADAVRRVSSALGETLREVEAWRRDWVSEKKKWARWRSRLGEDMALKSVAHAFSRAAADIDEALGLVSGKLEPLLEVQQKAGDIEATIGSLINRIDSMMLQQRGGPLRGGTPTIFSVGYLRQIIDLIHDPGKIVKAVPLPDGAFLRDKGWVAALQAGVFVVLLGLLRRYRPRFIGHAGRRFLGRRPISVALFVSIFTLSFLYGPQPTFWRMVVQGLAGVATASVVTGFVRATWIKRAIYVLVLVMICFQLLLILGVPLALVRLFILVWTTAGGFYYGWRARREAAAGTAAWQVWLLRLVVVMFGVIALTDVIGLGGLSVQMMDGAIRTAMLSIMGWAMIRVVRVALELGVEFLPIQNFVLIRSNTAMILARATLVCNVLIVIFVAANLLVAWKLYAIPAEAVQDLFGFGFSMGAHKITVGLVLVAGIILYGAFVLSWGMQNFLMENVLSRGQMDTGARLSVVRLVHYALILVGFFFALSAMGFELKNITIIGGALGVGIGFGMQAIVNNFVSGLILLFERPIKVGDVIQLSDGQQGRVANLGLRATTIETFDRAEVVVPNGDLISSQVTNWTLGDRSMRIIIPVGVAYGSDVETVMRILTAVASDSDKVLKDPQPMVLFLNFGDSSLDFQMRAWIADFNERRIIQSALIREIDRRFRAEGVEIPFPQRDLHLRSVDGKAAERLKGEPKAPLPDQRR